MTAVYITAGLTSSKLITCLTSAYLIVILILHMMLILFSVTPSWRDLDPRNK